MAPTPWTSGLVLVVVAAVIVAVEVGAWLWGRR